MSVAPLAAGQRIDSFELQQHLHRGGMASLWRVTRPDLTLPAVMKVPSIEDDPTSIVGFEVEQMIMPLLGGPHVPRFIAAGGFESQPYIVMEYIEGATLRPKLDQAPLPAAEVAAIGKSVAEALHDLHQQHVIHLDVKPSNILFRPSGQTVLIDYGLARHEKLPDLLAEEFRLPLGTAPYISPEQVMHVRDDPRSDLFALGAVLYHLATGQRAFGTPTSVAGLRKRLYRAPVPPRALNPDCPPWLQEIILHCLEVDAEQRYGSAAQVAFDLTQPRSVTLTARSDLTRPIPFGQQAGRWLRSLGAVPERRNVTQQLMRAPIVLAAVDLSQEWEALADALRATVRRVLQSEPYARLACLSVLRTPRIGLDTPADEAGRNRHVQRLVQLQHWARPLALPPHRVTYHVLEAPDPAAAIIEYARANRVDHIVIGSRGASGLRRLLGSVSARVVAEAPCSVTVVKVPRDETLAA
ncbi:MAG TPA: bifunctional serine/threonine-protein kinase/universal stress protein [Burkholderiaceae bacterium]|nr:bifunctional serine/threonine-protein kinase/universal stress protein [Burkholderiaceae bacterium]